MVTRTVSAPAPAAPAVTAAQDRAEERAVATEQQAAKEASARLRTMRTGGLRLLFSPMRQMGETQNTKLGG